MKSFTVHEPPEPPAERIDRASSLVFVKEGFSWGAFLFAPLWLVLHSLWAGFGAYLAVAIVWTILADLAGFGSGITVMGFFVLHLLIGFEADTLERWTLTRRGWRELGAVTGHSRDDCERNFFNAWLPQQGAIDNRSDATVRLGRRIAQQ